ncbi:MAG: hypothetical protein ACI4S3_07390 [Candidatus Gastranaerophilaceae bacterium]
MFKNLVMLGAGWFIYTKEGRKTAKNICMNCVPLLEKELGIKIMEPIKELTKEPKDKVKDYGDDT